jgi:hypothetical protein
MNYDDKAQLTSTNIELALTAPRTPMTAEVLSFRTALERLINSHSRENGSATPDFILSGYLIDCLEAYDRALQAREKWSSRADTSNNSVS